MPLETHSSCVLTSILSFLLSYPALLVILPALATYTCCSLSLSGVVKLFARRCRTRFVRGRFGGWGGVMGVDWPDLVRKLWGKKENKHLKMCVGRHRAILIFPLPNEDYTLINSYSKLKLKTSAGSCCSDLPLQGSIVSGCLPVKGATNISVKFMQNIYFKLSFPELFPYMGYQVMTAPL